MLGAGDLDGSDLLRFGMSLVEFRAFAWTTLPWTTLDKSAAVDLFDRVVLLGRPEGLYTPWFKWAASQREGHRTFFWAFSPHPNDKRFRDTYKAKMFWKHIHELTKHQADCLLCPYVSAEHKHPYGPPIWGVDDFPCVRAAKQRKTS